jgi:hydrogenase maturation protease
VAVVPRVLVLGYGNPGRCDDGLGPAVAAAVAAWDLPGVTVESNYQLVVEDAAEVAAHDVVIFADATSEGTRQFRLDPLEESDEVGFCSHSLGPGAVTGLARRLFGACPRAFLLAIRGEDFNSFGEGLSATARQNLTAALVALEPMLRSGEVAAADTPASGGQ